MDSENILNKRINKIIRWIKNPYNFTFVVILAFTIIIRLYYFSLTKNQPLWWDEAEYMIMARAWAYNLEYAFTPVRPVLFSLIIAVFFKITSSEFLPRMLIWIFSVLSVVGIYYLGKELYNRKIGLLSSFIMSIFYLNLFFSFRLLVELPSLTSFIFAGFFFWKYFKDNSNKKALYLAALITAIGTLFKLSTALILFAILIYVLITEKLNCLKKKEYWIAALIFILILSPYLIWGYLQFNGFVITQAGSWNAAKEDVFMTSMGVLKNYLVLFPTYLSWPLLVIFLLGVASFYKLILGFDLLLKKKIKN